MRGVVKCLAPFTSDWNGDFELWLFESGKLPLQALGAAGSSL